MNDNIKQQLCREDFYLMLQNACLQAGGGNAEKFKKLTLEEVVNMLAQNGIRMVYMPEKHMNSIKVVWEDPSQKKTDDVKFYTGDGKELNILPKKLFLLWQNI